MLAVSLNLEEISMILLATGADANIADYDERTPLHEAAAQGFGNVRMCALLKSAFLSRPIFIPTASVAGQNAR